MKVLTSTIVGVVTVVILSGCGSGTKVSTSPATPSVSAPQLASPSPARTKQFAFGDVVKVRGLTEKGNDGDITVSAPTFSVRDNGAKTSYYDFSQPSKNGVFAVFSISAIGVGGKFDISSFDFYVRGADGTHYTDALATFDPSLSGTTLAPGEPIKGNVSFDIPDKSGTLVYSPTFMPALGEWKFNGLVSLG